jgi:hypothetical protein
MFDKFRFTFFLKDCTYIPGNCHDWGAPFTLRTTIVLGSIDNGKVSNIVSEERKTRTVILHCGLRNDFRKVK